MSIQSKSWSPEKGRVKRNNVGQEINARLDQIEALANDLFNRARLSGIKETPLLFDYVKRGVMGSGLLDRKAPETTSIITAFDDFIKQLREGTRPTKRKINTNVSYSYLQMFITLKNTLTDILPPNTQFNYLNTKAFAEKFNSYRTTHWSDVSALKYIRLFRRFLLWAKDMHLFDFEEFPLVLSMPDEHEATLFALTDAELRRIENLDLSERLSLEKVRDLFLISCYTGLRYSDVSRLGAEHIGANEIRLSTKKTDDNFRCTITQPLRKILDKYAPEYHFHKISAQRANDHMKTIAQKAEINSMIEVITYKNGLKIVDAKSKCELIAWHCSRRTFVTLSLLKGMQPAAVQAVSGHKKDSKAFNRYVKFADNQVDEQMNAAWE